MLHVWRWFILIFNVEKERNSRKKKKNVVNCVAKQELLQLDMQ